MKTWVSSALSGLDSSDRCGAAPEPGTDGHLHCFGAAHDAERAPEKRSRGREERRKRRCGVRCDGTQRDKGFTESDQGSTESKKSPADYLVSVRASSKRQTRELDLRHNASQAQQPATRHEKKSRVR